MKRIALLAGVCAMATLLLAGSAPALGKVDRAGNKLRAQAMKGKPRAIRVLKAPASSCSGEDDSAAAFGVQEDAMRCMVNYARERAGLARLDGDAKLERAASRKAGDILRCNAFSHDACGRDFLYWFRRSGYLNGRCWWAGENLAWGTGSLGSAREIMAAWLRSPSHRANILGSDYRDFGVALRAGSLSGASEAHVWVNHFGRHC